MKKYIVFIFLIFVFMIIAGCGHSNIVSISPTQTITPILISSPTPTFQPTLNPQSSGWEYMSPENIGNIELVDQWGKGYVTGVDITEDGSMIAVAASTGVYLYDTSNYKETLILEPSDYVVSAIAISPDKQYI